MKTHQEPDEVQENRQERKSMTNRKTAARRTLWLLALAVAATAAMKGAAKSSDGKLPASPAPAPEVPVLQVSERSIPFRFEATGYSVASHQVDVRARVGGYVVSAAFGEGDFVPAGALLYAIDPRPFVAAHARTTAEVARARAAVELARQEFARAETLFETASISAEEMARRQTAASTAEATLAAALAQQDASALDLEFTRITAPISGRITRALVKPGNLVSGGDDRGTLLTTLLVVNPLHVMVNLDEPSFQQLAAFRSAGKELRAKVKLGFSDKTFAGKVDYLSPSMDSRSGTAQARVVLSNDDGQLAAGLFARIEVVADAERPRVLVPEEAVGATQGRRFVLVVDENNTVTHREVTLGERLGDERLVLDGLSAGESIVVGALHRVRPGMTVQPASVTQLASH